LSAQDVQGEIFTVPFTFTAEGHEIEPGTYEIRRDFSQFLMSIVNVKTGEKQLFSVRPETRAAIPEKGLLVFRGCGNRKTLSEFHVRGANLFSAAVEPGRRETPEMERCSRVDAVTIAAR
jgi:hypothetical protein